MSVVAQLESLIRIRAPLQRCRERSWFVSAHRFSGAAREPDSYQGTASAVPPNGMRIQRL